MVDESCGVLLSVGNQQDEISKVHSERIVLTGELFFLKKLVVKQDVEDVKKTTISDLIVVIVEAQVVTD